MKNFKIFIWILMIFLIQTIAVHYICPAAPPMIIIPFIISLSFLEGSFRYAMTVSVICGACAGSFTGDNFFFSLLLSAAVSLFVMRFKRKRIYIHELIKTVLCSAVFVFIAETAVSLAINPSIGTYMHLALPSILLSDAITAVFAVIIYPLLKKTVYSHNEKKNFII